MEITGTFKLQLGDFILDIALRCPGRGLTAVVGASGSGKTTLLKCMAGLLRAPAGYLAINGQIWQSAAVFLPTYQRPLGYVFQEACLFSHLTVRGNLEYGRKRTKAPLPRIDYEEVLDILNLRHLLPRRVDHLSGGEAQRVAIGRALFRNPEILILDEPLASLDSDLKREIIPYMRMLKQFHIPIIYVTHSDAEVQQLADYQLRLKAGHIVSAAATKKGTPSSQSESK